MVEWFNGWTGLLLIAAVSFLAHEPWRWLGLALGARLSVESELFQWVKAVSTALVAALVMRLMLFPPEGLGHLSLLSRLIGLFAGIAVFWLAGQRVAAGVFGGAVALYFAGLLLG